MKYKYLIICFISFIFSTDLFCQKLNLRSDKLDKLPSIVLDSSWVEIDLRKNKLRFFPLDLNEFHNLESLRLASNPMEWPDTLIGFSALKYLDMWDTDVSSVPNYVEGFESLEELDLRNTYLDEGDRESLERVFPKVQIHLSSRCDCQPKR
jgi:Leucine-rich repeat (LRR) protein